MNSGESERVAPNSGLSVPCGQACALKASRPWLARGLAAASLPASPLRFCSLGSLREQGSPQRLSGNFHGHPYGIKDGREDLEKHILHIPLLATSKQIDIQHL